MSASTLSPPPYTPHSLSREWEWLPFVLRFLPWTTRLSFLHLSRGCAAILLSPISWLHSSLTVSYPWLKAVPRSYAMRRMFSAPSVVRISTVHVPVMSSTVVSMFEFKLAIPKLHKRFIDLLSALLSRGTVTRLLLNVEFGILHAELPTVFLPLHKTLLHLDLWLTTTMQGDNGFRVTLSAIFSCRRLRTFRLEGSCDAMTKDMTILFSKCVAAWDDICSISVRGMNVARDSSAVCEIPVPSSLLLLVTPILPVNKPVLQVTNLFTFPATHLQLRALMLTLAFPKDQLPALLQVQFPLLEVLVLQISISTADLSFLFAVWTFLPTVISLRHVFLRLVRRLQTAPDSPFQWPPDVVPVLPPRLRSFSAEGLRLSVDASSTFWHMLSAKRAPLLTHVSLADCVVAPPSFFECPVTAFSQWRCLCICPSNCQWSPDRTCEALGSLICGALDVLVVDTRELGISKTLYVAKMAVERGVKALYVDDLHFQEVEEHVCERYSMKMKQGDGYVERVRMNVEYCPRYEGDEESLQRYRQAYQPWNAELVNIQQRIFNGVEPPHS